MSSESISKRCGLMAEPTGVVLLVCDWQRWWDGEWGWLAGHTHWRSALLPTSGRLAYCNTCPRVSGNFVARKLPAARAPAANMMGTALVMPTNDWKMLMPRTAATLQRALRKPNAVVLVENRFLINIQVFHDVFITLKTTWITSMTAKSRISLLLIFDQIKPVQQF